MFSEKEIEEKLLEFEPLIKYNASKYGVRGYATEDLEQEFRMATFRAIKNFDDSKGAVLKTFVIKYINRCVSALLVVQATQKRGVAELSLHSYEDETENLWLLSSAKNPEEIDEDLRNEEMIKEFLMTRKKGDWSIEILYHNVTVKEIAQREQVAHQYVYTMHNKNLKDLKIKIREWFE